MNNKKELVNRIVLKLSSIYQPITTLYFDNVWQLVVATILSAQARDTKVNEITEVLFKKYKLPKDFIHLSQEKLEEKIKSINYYKTKAKRIFETALLIEEKYKGQVPNKMDTLLSLPGIARKSANVIMSSAYGIDEGIVVDTHVRRLSQRIGLTKETSPVKIEGDLLKIVPKKEWGKFSHYLIFLGREICQSQKPKCFSCVLLQDCQYETKNISNK